MGIDPIETNSREPGDGFRLSRYGLAWSDQSVRLIVLAVGVMALLWLARGVIGPFIVAAVFAYAFTPIVSAVEGRTGLPRVVVIAIGYVLLLGAIGVLIYFAAAKTSREIAELTSNGHDIVSSAMHRLFGDTVVVAGHQYSVEDLATQLKAALVSLFSSPSSAVQTAERAVDFILQAILSLIIAFYFLLDGHRFGRFVLRFLDREQRADALRLAHQIHDVLGRWLRGQMFLICLVAAVLYVVLGPILHVPFSLLLAVASGVLEIIPLVGPIVAAAVAGTVTFATRGTDTTIVVLAVYLVVRQVEDQVIMPIVIGRAVHLHPVITIFAVLVGLGTWGVLGGLLGVPIAAAINVTLHVLYPEETGGPGAMGEAGGGVATHRRLWLKKGRTGPMASRPPAPGGAAGAAPDEPAPSAP